MKNNTETNQPKKKRTILRGCLTVIIVFFVLCAGIGIVMSLTMDKVTTSKSEISKYIDVTDEQSASIEQILSSCGIEQISFAEHDALLDNAHSEGETGYRLSINDNVDNIILYLNADKTVYSLSYNTYTLYSDGTVIATLQDYTFTTDEVSDLMIKCQDKVKEVLKSPSTADFPDILKWGFKKEKNIVTVQGYVDAQNSLGVEMRSNFQFIIDNDTNTIRSFIFDGEERIK